MVKRKVVKKKKRLSVKVSKEEYDFHSLEESYATCHINGSKITLDRFLISSNYRFMFDYWKYRNSDQYRTSYSRKDAEPFVGKVIRLSGVVAGVREFKSGWKILLRNPKIDGVICDSPKEFDKFSNMKAITSSALKQSIFLDSHMWISVDKLLPYVLDYAGRTVNFAAGSMISVVCVLDTYKGRVEGGRIGLKYGFKDYIYFIHNYQLFTDGDKEIKVGKNKFTGYDLVVYENQVNCFAIVNALFNKTVGVIPDKFCLFGLKFQAGNSPEPGELVIYDNSIPSVFKEEADRIMDLPYTYERKYDIFKKLLDSELDKLIFRYSKELSDYLNISSKGKIPSQTIIKARVESKNYRKERRKLSSHIIELERDVSIVNEVV